MCFVWAVKPKSKYEDKLLLWLQKRRLLVCFLENSIEQKILNSFLLLIIPRYCLTKVIKNKCAANTER